MDFVLALHSHLPYVLRHGRWPHGSDWLCEAALDSYLPLIEKVHELASRGVRAPLTLSISPVLANQLADPFFASELDAFFGQRLASCDDARRTLPQTGDAALLPLVDFWEARFRRLQARFEQEGRDIAAAFARLEAAGHVEVMTCAATHGYLPLLARDESIRLQLAVAVAEHRRVFGRSPAGCWLPECAYRPGGWWEPLPGSPHAGPRVGIEAHLAEAGLKFFFTDAHLAQAGSALGGYAEVPIGAERFDAVRRDRPRHRGDGARRTPYRAYLVASQGTAPPPPVAVLVRDPRSSMQVWSKDLGYPGDEWYLEFHKIRWPGGLKLWRVSWPRSDLGAKRPYDPSAALAQVAMHGSHFASLLASLQHSGGADTDGVIAAPFDTELFGHWWFEGVDFLGSVYRNLGDRPLVRARTASEHLQQHPPRVAIELAAGSWGAGGDHGMWLNEQTHWTWRRLWPLEDRFWDVVPRVLGSDDASPVLAQAARELLLAQASDWQFIITTGVVTDYAERRFTLHANDADRLVDFLEAAADGAMPEEAGRMANELQARDAVFPDVLRQVRAVVGRSAAAVGA
ncbi:MAG TPA: 1,4-alpha-glucan branching protein domain-containing protein [Gemmatimonadales bacterium]|nr:1,4-alpha-glucan branching protein domain-containing protein [Gemmatimonadales bacterium]